jgi:hypothetical protein
MEGEEEMSHLEALEKQNKKKDSHPLDKIRGTYKPPRKPTKALKFLLRNFESNYKKQLEKLQEKFGDEIPQGIPWYDYYQEAKKYIMI